uniref:SUEL-type lectin domain-containing protein n=1 Tax=Maylandia zebra TaxID=106582 RepID=A0A3P9DMW7_9CICH
MFVKHSRVKLNNRYKERVPLLSPSLSCFPSATCEGSEANLQCGEVLVIHGANYGRRDKTTCSDGRPASQLQVVQCSSQTSTSVVAKSCNGKNSCTISASNSVFGDPCVGTYKYLEVDYTCQFQSATCEGSQANLQCGEVLVIHGANYGRRDKTTCSAGRPASQLHNVQCVKPFADLLSICNQRCNGKNSCTISASNSVFGDPCVGTYKYLEVDYTCQCKYLKPGVSSSKPQGPVSCRFWTSPRVNTPSVSALNSNAHTTPK